MELALPQLRSRGPMKEGWPCQSLWGGCPTEDCHPGYRTHAQPDVQMGLMEAHQLKGIFSKVSGKADSPSALASCVAIEAKSLLLSTGGKDWVPAAKNLDFDVPMSYSHDFSKAELGNFNLY